MQLKYDVFIPNHLNNALAPIILLHSIVETRTTWLHIAPEIMKFTGRKVYAIDARNHGESPWTDEYSLDAMAKDLEEFLLQNKIDNVILVGHSIGGKVAIEYTFRKPHTVEKLIIEDSTPRNFVKGGGKLVNFLLSTMKELNNILSEYKDKEKAIDSLKDIIKQFNSELGVTKAQIMNYDFDLLPLEWKGDHFSLKLNIDAMADAIINNKLQQNISGTFEGDVLLLYGKKSQFKIGSDDEFLKYFPRTTKIEFENARHNIHQVFPKEFIQEVVNFINKGCIMRARY